MTREDQYIRVGNQARLRAAKSILEEMTPRSPKIGATKDELRKIVDMIETIDNRISEQGFKQMASEIEERKAAIEEEREACRKAVRSVADELHPERDHLRWSQWTSAIEEAEKRIRARSGSSPTPPGEDIRDLETLRHDNEVLRQRLNEAIERYQDLLRGKPDERGRVNIST